MNIDARCRCCNNNHDHTCVWHAEATLAHVRTTCQGCGAQGSASLAVEVYTAAYSHLPPEAALVELMGAVSEALAAAVKKS